MKYCGGLKKRKSCMSSDKLCINDFDCCLSAYHTFSAQLVVAKKPQANCLIVNSHFVYRCAMLHGISYTIYHIWKCTFY